MIGDIKRLMVTLNSALGSNVQFMFVCSFLNKTRDMIHGWILCMFKPNITLAIIVGLNIKLKCNVTPHNQTFLTKHRAL